MTSRSQPISENIAAEKFPSAIVSRSSRPQGATRLWWIAAASLLAAGGLIATSIKSHGPSITIRFAEGHGLKLGDVLRHRGIAIGEVTDISLRSDLSSIAVKVRLEPQGASVARRGSQFWIERPKLSLSRVSGLETVVGAKYLNVLPGPVESPLDAEFEGLESPPILADSDDSEITIRFRDGNGLQVGDPAKHRGIVIGEVTSIDLDDKLSAVAVQVRLVGAGRKLAREGTQFWIERPRMNLSEVRGLETLVGGRYIAMQPGADNATPRFEFPGLEQPPVAELPAGSLEIVLHAPQRWGIDRGVPVTYRGLTVGQVHSVGLSSDGTSVVGHAAIEPRFRSLVRANSVFWSTSGIDVNVGLRGVQFTADTLTTIAQGGVAFATPENPGPAANTGQRFPFVKTPRDEWLTWAPHISTNETQWPADWPVPQPQRAVVRWEERTFGFRRQRERSGTILFLASRKLLGPADVLAPTDSALGPVTLEVAGAEITLDPKRTTRAGDLAVYLPEIPLPENVSLWPLARVRSAKEPENCLLWNSADSEPLPLAANSLNVRADAWHVAAHSSVGSAWHGAIVASLTDGHIIGVLLADQSQARIVPLNLESRDP